MSRITTTPTTVDAYVAAAPDAAQPILRELRDIIRSTVPDAEETISYGTPHYRYHGRFPYFAAHEHHGGLYALGPASEYPDGLKALAVGQGTIGFPIVQPLPTTVIRDLVHNRAGHKEDSGP